VHARSCIFVRFCPSKFEKMYEIDDEIWGRKIPGFHTASLLFFSAGISQVTSVTGESSSMCTR